jgi:uncharacterized protein YcnI
MTWRIPKAAAAAALAVVLVLVSPLAASAHIRVSPGQTEPGATNVQLSFSVPTEPDQSPNGETTVLVRIALDQAHPFSTVYVLPVPGWTGRAETTVLPKPVEVDGKPLTEAVTSVVWTASPGSGIPKGAFQNFVISVSPIPDVGRLTMPAEQQLSSGAVLRWNQRLPHGKGAQPEHPAPTLFVTETPPTLTGGMAGMSGMSGMSGPTAAVADDSSSDSTLPLVLSIAALVLGAGGLVLGGLAYLRQRRRAPARA